MRKKVRIFSTLVSLALVLAVMCVGIWAASKAEIGSTATLSFNPTDVNATVAFADGGGDKTVSFFSDAQKQTALTTLSYDENDTDDVNDTFYMEFAPLNRTSQTWVFTVTVTNDFATGSSITIDSKLSATVSQNSNFSVDIKVGTQTAENTEVVSVGTPLVYTITISINDGAPINSFSDTLTFSLELTQTAA